MKTIIYLSILSFAFQVFAQDDIQKNTTDFNLGQGLSFNLNNEDYRFNISGFIQPLAGYEKMTDLKGSSYFYSRHSFFMISGRAVKEKISFMLQTDFSNASPLYDAWIAYHPTAWLTITGGQKQTFVNNREMIYREDRLQFTQRSLSSRIFSNSGREFGLFVETKFGEKIGFAPKVALTSGDGRSSFGTDSRDTDLGGLKIGGRLDIYPLGYLKEGNDLYTADLLHEEKPKLILGVAGSLNQGASEARGEGHGRFLMYDVNRDIKLPDYRQIYGDLLIKYKGFSLLYEYSNASATKLDGLYVDPNALNLLVPQQISNFLVLGNSHTIQGGYVTKTGYGFDVRFDQGLPEFDTNNASILQEFKNFNVGFTKYFDKNNLKLQTAFSSTKYNSMSSINQFELLMQIVF